MASHDEPPWEVYTKVGGQKHFSRDYPATVEGWVGPVSQRLRITSDFHDCQRVQEIVLYAGVDRIEFVTELRQYRGREHLHVVTFPNNLQGVVPVFDDRFGCVVKRKGKGYLDYRTWQWRNYSDCGARRAYQWLDLSSSVVLEFGSERGATIPGRVAVGNTSVIIPNDRDIERVAQGLQEALVGKGVPVTIFPDDCDRQRRQRLPHQDSTMPMDHPNEDLPWGTSFRFILDVADRNGLWQELRRRLPQGTIRALRAQREAWGWAAALVYDEAMPDGWPPLPTVILTTKTEADLQAAVRSWAGQIRRTAKLRLPPGAMGTVHNDKGNRGQYPFPSLDDYGLALLNRGTPLCSVEHDNTLVLILMHAVSWARTHRWGPDRLPFHLAAEHKDHRFEYALYPHEGDWRSGQVAQAAYDYNNPLIVFPLDRQAKPAAPQRLPQRLSFVETSAGPIVTGLKPPGYPLAGHNDPPGPPLKELALRMYEPTGFATPVEVRFFAGLRAAQRANLLDEPQGPETVKGGVVQAKLKPFEIRTMLLQPQAAASLGPPAALAPEREASAAEGPPVLYFKHWRHNVGAEPLGFSPVGISLSGEVQTGVKVSQGGVTVNRLTVGVSNNLRHPWRGRVWFETAPGWRVVPEALALDVPAGGGAEQEVCLVFDTDRRHGLVKARLEHDGQVYQDVLEVGEPLLLDWGVSAVPEGLRVEVANLHADAIEAEVFVVSPHETWGPGGVRPWRSALALASGEHVQLPVTAPEKCDHWIVVKLAYNGRVEYKMVSR
jgi:hypothetical protein